MTTINLWGREFEADCWYAPRKLGPRTKARLLKESRRDAVHDWVIYEVLNNDARRETRSCTSGVWCQWAGERVETPEASGPRQAELA